MSDNIFIYLLSRSFLSGKCINIPKWKRVKSLCNLYFKLASRQQQSQFVMRLYFKRTTSRELKSLKWLGLKRRHTLSPSISFSPFLSLSLLSYLVVYFCFASCLLLIFAFSVLFQSKLCVHLLITKRKLTTKRKAILQMKENTKTK